MILLTGCQSNPEVVYENYNIPDMFLTKCERDFKDNTVREVILGLDKTIRCYESKQEGLKSFINNETEEEK